MTDSEYTSAMEQLFVNADANGNDKLSPEEMRQFTASVMKAANMTAEAISLVIDGGKFDTWPPCEDFMRNDKWASMEEFMKVLPSLKDDILKGCPNKPKEGDTQLFHDMSDPYFEHEIHGLFSWADKDADGLLNEAERKSFLESIMKAAGINQDIIDKVIVDGDLSVW
jgi:hypothetical protein